MEALSRRSAILIGAAAFCAAVGVAWYLGNAQDSEDGSPSDQVASSTKRTPGGTIADSPPLEPSARPQPQSLLAATGEKADIFATKSWEPPPHTPPSAKPKSQPETEAPPPFNFMGMMTQASGKRIYYLARGDRAYAVGDGAKIDDTYRVNGLRGKKLSITYLPDGVEQVLPMAGPTESDANGGKEAADAPTYIPDPHAVVEAPQPPAPAPEIVQAPGNFARPRRPVPGGGMAPGAAPVAAVPDKAPVAAQVPEGLSFEPPPAFNMEKSQEFSIGTEADKDRAASQQDEN